MTHRVEHNPTPAAWIRDRSRLRTRLSLAAGVWGLLYAAYRGYYAAGGTFARPGTPAADSPFRSLNLTAAVIVAVGAVLPVAVLPLWSRRRARAMLLAACWLVAVFCCMHALINMTVRVLSLSGLVRIDYPSSVWASVDRRAADLQDLFGNEPWFFLEGLAYAALGWIGADPTGPRRRWALGGVAAVAALFVLGLLSATHVIGKAILG